MDISARMIPQVRPPKALMATNKIIARQLKTNAFYNIHILDRIITNNRQIDIKIFVFLRQTVP